MIMLQTILRLYHSVSIIFTIVIILHHFLLYCNMVLDSAQFNILKIYLVCVYNIHQFDGQIAFCTYKMILHSSVSIIHCPSDDPSAFEVKLIFEQNMQQLCMDEIASIFWNGSQNPRIPPAPIIILILIIIGLMGGMGWCCSLFWIISLDDDHPQHHSSYW